MVAIDKKTTTYYHELHNKLNHTPFIVQTTEVVASVLLKI